MLDVNDLIVTGTALGVALFVTSDVNNCDFRILVAWLARPHPPNSDLCVVIPGELGSGTAESARTEGGAENPKESGAQSERGIHGYRACTVHDVRVSTLILAWLTA